MSVPWAGGREGQTIAARSSWWNWGMMCERPCEVKQGILRVPAAHLPGYGLYLVSSEAGMGAGARFKPAESGGGLYFSIIE